jgi:small ligand-binding sensory domain FIST
VFPPSVRDDTVILHGCRPVSTFMEITRIEGAEVFELDGKPALEVIERMLGVTLGSTASQDLSLIATLGEKQGDPYAPYDENSYVNRLILRANRSTGSITLFEKDFHLGTRVQIMARDNALMLDSVRNGIGAINATEREGQPLLALYIDCAGRASARSGAAVEEAELVARGLDPAIPFLGFYSGVEIAPFDGYSRPLDWTGLLTILSTR